MDKATERELLLKADQREFVLRSRGRFIEAISASLLLSIYRQGGFVQEVDEGIQVVSFNCYEVIPVPSRLPRSVWKMIRKKSFSFSIDQRFPEIVSLCAPPRKASDSGRQWIRESMFAALLSLHEQGMAHSIEIYKADQLVGGSFGVKNGGIFTALSVGMSCDGAGDSSIAVLLAALACQGFSAVNAVRPSHASRLFGGRKIEGDDYKALCERAFQENAGFFCSYERRSAQDFVRSLRIQEDAVEAKPLPPAPPPCLPPICQPLRQSKKYIPRYMRSHAAGPG